jgi:hypothetical protein
MDNTALLLTNHGNEPYLLGVGIALACGMDHICVPYYYQGNHGASNQARILSETFPSDLHRIYLSKSLGRTLKPLLRGAQDKRPFPVYVEDLFLKNRKSTRGITNIEDTLQGLLVKGIDATSLANENHRYTFTSSNINMALNIGLPIKSPVSKTFFIFTALMSLLYSTPVSEDDLDQIRLLQPLAEYWAEIEGQMIETFIPKINALSHLHADPKGVTYTPPLAKLVVPADPLLKRTSVLIILSGTGYDRDKLCQVGLSIQKEYQVVSLSRRVHYAKIMPPTVFADPKLVSVISRGGWGTTWKCLIHSKPIGYIQTPFEQDPEIAHSIRTLDSLHLGFNMDLSTKSAGLPNQFDLAAISQNIERTIGHDSREFLIGNRDYSRDGIGFVADCIQHRLDK